MWPRQDMVDYAYNPLAASFFALLEYCFLRRRSVRHAFASTVRQRWSIAFTDASPPINQAGK
ncbi:hypothetical protein CI102_9835 [Trichoderma harzianum]|nr:hypothetical protein CI102_9835 [Trichoderma harzianum]